MLDDIVLEPEQVNLLFFLVESMKSVPREERIKIIGDQDMYGKAHIMHRGFPDGKAVALLGDIEALHHVGMVHLTMLGTGTFAFDIAPRGFKYYELHQAKSSEPAERLQGLVKRYIDSDRFRSTYPIAFAKWAKAETLLWESDSTNELSTVGHLCREAMQEFSTVLVERYKPSGVDSVKAHDVARLRAVINHRANILPSTLTPFLEALIAYWGTLSDLVQRQEHAGQKEGQPVTWEDARRIVFQTAVVFLEIDKAITTTA
jgi:hypothetical protein